MDTSVTPESLDGATPKLLRSLASEFHLYAVGGFVLARDSGRPQNVSLAVDRKGKDMALYPKIHQIAILDEDRHYDPGDLPVPFELDGIGAVAFICYDLRFPELFRSIVDECGLVLIIASWPASRQLHWDILLRARAIESQSFVVGANRVGEGDGLVFSGGSAIVDPMGKILAKGDDHETIVMGEINPSLVREVRSTMPFLKDRKPQLFKFPL